MTTGEPGGLSNSGLPSTSGNSSLLGWAMSSLTHKGKVPDQLPVVSANSGKPIVSAPSSTSLASDASDSMPTNLSLSDLSDHAAPSSPTTSTDGWGELENGAHEIENDKDGWDDLEPVEEQKPPPALATIYAAQKRPQVSSTKPKSTVPAPAKEDDNDLWGSIAAPAPKTAAKPMKSKVPTSDDEDPWGAIAAPPPKTSIKPLKPKPTTSNDNDPWASIAAPPPTTTAKPLSASRGRGGRAAPMKLGAQRLNRTSTDI